MTGKTEQLKKCIELMQHDLTEFEAKYQGRFAEQPHIGLGNRKTRCVNEATLPIITCHPSCLEKCAGTCYVINICTRPRPSCRKCEAKNTVLRRIDTQAALVKRKVLCKGRRTAMIKAGFKARKRRNRAGYSVSSEWVSRRKALSPMKVIPFLSIHGLSYGSPVITTLRKESRTWRREYVSCSRFPGSEMEKADCTYIRSDALLITKSISLVI